MWRGLFDLSEGLLGRGSCICGTRVSEHRTHWLIPGTGEVTASLFSLRRAASA